MEKYFWKNNTISLRIINKDDIETIYNNFYDTELIINSKHELHLPEVYDKTEKFVLEAIKLSRENEEIWFIIENNKGEKVGYAKISYIDDRLGNCDCSVFIFKQFRNNKYATFAYEILLKYIFEERRLHKVHCCILQGNKEGERFLQKFNFKFECARTQMFYIHGKYVTEYYFGLLENEYILHINNNKVTKYDENYLSKLPYSTLGEYQNKKYIKKSLNVSREYFWSYDGITLRATTKEDYKENHKILFDSNVCRFYDNDVKLPFQTDVDELVEDNTFFKGGNKRLEFAIMNDEKEYIGCINLCDIDNRNGKFSLSILIVNDHRNRGYGSKALRLIMSYAFFELRLNKLIVVINDGNIASARIMRKAGLKVEGVQRESSFYKGKYIDAIFFGITKKEFIEANA